MYYACSASDFVVEVVAEFLAALVFEFASACHDGGVDVALPAAFLVAVAGITVQVLQEVH